MPNMRYVIIGAGAIGGSVGGLLERAGESIVLVARGEHGDCIRENGLCIRTKDFEYRTSCLCYASVQEVDWADGDVALVATKLNDAVEVLDELLAAAGPGLPVVMLTNGIDGSRWASERFESVAAAMVWMLCTHLDPGEVVLHAGGRFGVIELGDSQAGQSFTKALMAAGIESSTHEDIEPWLLSKLLRNVGATAQALIPDGWQAVAQAAKEEAQKVFQAHALTPIEQAVFDRRVTCVEAVQVAGQPRMGGSTWQSRQRGKPLETEYLEGVIVRLGQQKGVATPVNTALLEASKTPRDYSAKEITASASKT